MWQARKLPCGLRIVMEQGSSRAVYCGIVVCAGTRHEQEAQSGMAHFVEHLSFKGTQRRTARQINGLLERRGGELGAFTSKQETVYYAQVLPEDFSIAADLLCDMVFRSTFPQDEINKEVEVICDEIESYLDNPSELIFDEFEHRLFQGKNIGRDTLGSPQSLRQYTTADAQRFAQDFYQPYNAVFYVYGDIAFNKVERAITQALAKSNLSTAISIPPAKLQSPPIASQPFYEEVNKATHQAHVIVGAPTMGGTDKRCIALQLLNNILGGPAPNSRFNLALRERAGLVYQVDSYASIYPDVGIWMTYFGCDTHDVQRCLNLLHREIRRITDKPLSEKTLQAAKRQFIRTIRLGCDNFENYAVALGKTMANYDKYRSVDVLCQRIESVTPDDLHAVATTYLKQENLSTLLYR